MRFIQAKAKQLSFLFPLKVLTPNKNPGFTPGNIKETLLKA
jgi:hypothetical protein